MIVAQENKKLSETIFWNRVCGIFEENKNFNQTIICFIQVRIQCIEYFIYILNDYIFVFYIG